jgi:hypothetical protein
VQFALGDDSWSFVDEQQEQIEGLRRRVDFVVAASDLSAACIESERAESRDHRCSLSIPRVFPFVCPDIGRHPYDPRSESGVFIRRSHEQLLGGGAGSRRGR